LRARPHEVNTGEEIRMILCGAGRVTEIACAQQTS